MLVRNSLFIIFVSFITSCINVHDRLEERYNRTKDTTLVNFLHRSANDSVASWIDAGLDYTGGLLFNEWEVDSCFAFNKDKTKAIGSLLNQSVNDATIDDIVLFYCEKRSGEWYFFEGETMIIPRENYKSDISKPLSIDQLRQIARKHLLKGYYRYLWFFPFIIWPKEENFADPFWGSEYKKVDYIKRISRKKDWIEGLSVGQNVPNPLIGAGVIPLHIPIEAANPQIEIYTKSGKKVMKKSIFGAGAINVSINAKDFEPGEYVYYLSYSTMQHGHKSYGYRDMTVVSDTMQNE